MGVISDNARIIYMILLIILGSGLLTVAVGVYMWTRDQKNNKPLSDIDWGKEKEKMLLLATEKKANREQNKEDDKSEKREDPK